MNYSESIKSLCTDLSDIRGNLGDDGANKVYAILSVLEIGKTSVAYSKAILAAAEMALERCVIAKVENAKKDA